MNLNTSKNYCSGEFFQNSLRLEDAISIASKEFWDFVSNLKQRFYEGSEVLLPTDLFDGAISEACLQCFYMTLCLLLVAAFSFF